MRLLGPAFLAGIGVVLMGCTVDAGGGFGTLEDARLTASFAPGARLSDEGWFLVTGGYRVTPETMTLGVGALRLDTFDAPASSGGGVFDPAAPPPGYTLCHGGHCHHVDGRLVSYEDIQAELSGGGGGSYVTLVTMPVEADLDLLGGDARTLEVFDPSSELSEGVISRTQLGIRRFQMTGTVTEGTFGAERHPIRVDVSVDGPLSTLEESREVGVDAPPSVNVHADVSVAATFLDDQPLGAALSGEGVVIETGAIADAVAQGILSTPLGVVLE